MNSESSLRKIKLNNQIEKGQDNIFDDLGFDTEEAANLKIRADLMNGFAKIYIKARVDATGSS